MANGTNVGTIEYDARIDSSQLKKDASDVEKEAKQSGERFASGFATSMTVITAAGAAAFGALSVAAVTSFASYEQLTGGIETLFKGSSDVVKGYATNAYKTAGLSANQYMDTVTSFSASLIQGLGGDTAQAAKISDMAITDMSDNANKMGTSIGMIQNAYQGFAKDNYTMLDNLKLGYGGTATEMARLVNDSGVMGDSFKATAENVAAIPFDKVIEAIHKTQDEMGITGTTAKEASTTISGSWNSLTSAFSNVLTGVEGSGKQLSDTVLNMMNQLADKVPQIVGKMASGMTDAIKTVIDDKFGKGAFDVASTLTVLFGALAIGVTVYKGISAAMKMAAAAQIALNAAWVANPIGVILVAIVAVVAALAWFFTQTEMGKAVLASLGETMQVVGTWFVSVWENIKTTWGTVVSFFTGIIDGITSGFRSVIDFFAEWGLTILAIMLLPFTLVVAAIMLFWTPITDFFKGIWDGIVAIFTPIGEWFKVQFTAAWDAIVEVFSAYASFFSAVWDGIVAIFNGVAGWFSARFGEAWTAIKNVFAPVGKFFTDVWNGITSIFGKVGTSIGDAVGGAVKGVVNGILGWAEKTINGFIRTINGVIDVINKIPGVKIGQIGEMKIPRLADGGIVQKRPGGILANIGEGSQSEAVIPLDKLDSMLSGGGKGGGGNTYNINMSGVMTSSPEDERTIARRLLERINEAQRANGKPELGAA